MILLADDTGSWLSAMDWPLLIVLLQVVTLVYLWASLRHIARNQVKLGESLKALQEKGD